VTAASAPRRAGSDEGYVLDLCDEVLGSPSQRQARFEWLLGDPSTRTGRRTQLPVDGYWPVESLVVEYRERQHDEAVAFFDKPDRLTATGVPRGEQRKTYDERRDVEIPAGAAPDSQAAAHALAVEQAHRAAGAPVTPGLTSRDHPVPGTRKDTDRGLER